MALRPKSFLFILCFGGATNQICILSNYHKLIAIIWNPQALWEPGAPGAVAFPDTQDPIRRDSFVSRIHSGEISTITEKQSLLTLPLLMRFIYIKKMVKLYIFFPRKRTVLKLLSIKDTQYCFCVPHNHTNMFYSFIVVISQPSRYHSF